MELVEATGDDVDTLADPWFALATDMEQDSPLNRLSFSAPGEVPEDHIEGLIDREDVTVTLLTDGDATVGFLTLRRGGHPSREHSTYLEIVDPFVEEAYRGREIGSEVVEQVKREARENGSDYVTVSCEWHDVGARRFYDACGFEEKQVRFTHRLA